MIRAPYIFIWWGHGSIFQNVMFCYEHQTVVTASKTSGTVGII
jgi:hypothetical protein